MSKLKDAEGKVMSDMTEFKKWFDAVEAGDDPDWKEPDYLSPEWNEYLARMQLARGAWDAGFSAAMLKGGAE